MCFTDDLERYRVLLNEALFHVAARYPTSVESLKDAMVYALDGGKRLRGATVLGVCQSLGGDIQAGLGPALATEMIHAYSLVHDDLPCMDNDAMRRGKPSCHAKFGEAVALLAGDALLTAAFEIMATYGATPLNKRAPYVKTLAQAAGPGGMVAGQTMDLALEGKSLGCDAVVLMYRLKTGALFGAAARLGALAADGPKEVLKAAEDWGKAFGLAFQILDDIEDVKQGGKELNKDTLVKESSLEQAAVFARHALEESILSLEPFHGKDKFVRGLSLEYLSKIPAL